MGNIDGKETEYRLKNKKLQIFSKGESPFFENYNIYKLKGEDKMIFTTKINFKNSHTYEKSISFQHPNLLKTLAFKANLSDLIYTDPDTVFFEYSPTRLKEQIEEKWNTFGNFNEKELILLMKNCIDILSYFQKNGISHGNINPELIYYDKFSNCYKLLDQQLINGYVSAYQLAKEKNIFPYYSSPEMLIALQEKNLLFVKNSNKNDLFSLGMCLLEAATLLNNCDLYDKKTFKLFVCELENRLEIVKNNYNFEFYKALESLLILEPSKRPDPLELLNYLKGDLKIEIRTKKLNEKELPKIINEINIVYANKENEKKTQKTTDFSKTERSKSFNISAYSSKNIKGNESFINNYSNQNRENNLNNEDFIDNISQNNSSYYLNDFKNSLTLAKPNCFNQSFVDTNNNIKLIDSNYVTPTVTYLIKTKVKAPILNIEKKFEKDTIFKKDNISEKKYGFPAKSEKNFINMQEYLNHLDSRLEQTLNKSMKNKDSFQNSPTSFI